MTAVEIATGIIDKLQEENRACLETLHKAQDQLKKQDRQLVNKDQLIKVLEEKLRHGNDGILEMTNRQKELTIKNLEMQIQKLFKENEDLDSNLEAIKANICAKCETKLLLQENKENKRISKTYKPTTATTSKLFTDKRVESQAVCPNRLKSLERILEHKDKRISHLSKEVQQLKKGEKELTQKIYRLTKLLPMSRMPSETVTDCLLQEIQLLESQNECDGQTANDDLFKSVSKNILTNRLNVATDKSNKNYITNIKRSFKNLQKESISEEADLNVIENGILHKKLQKIYNDVDELKRFFISHTEKLSHGLNSTVNEYHQLKTQLQDIISNLNDIVRQMLRSHLHVPSKDPKSTYYESDDKFVISCLQERLKESLGMVSEYETEIKTLNEKLSTLKKEMLGKEKSVSKIVYLAKDNNEAISTNDVKKLKEIIKSRESQLEAAGRHISACETFIEELQKTYKHLKFEDFKVQRQSDVSASPKVVNAAELTNKELRKKLEVAEKNIKTLEDVIERLQNAIQKHEDENDRLDNEVHMLKKKKIDEMTVPQHRTSEYSQISVLSKKNVELTEKVQSLEGTNYKLKSELESYENVKDLLKAADQEKALLKNQLEASEKHISSLANNVETLQQELLAVGKKCSELETQVVQSSQEKNLAEKYESDVTALKNELDLKEEEIRSLKESLHDLETNALQMNHYRNSLHKEIEKLCNIIMENDDSDSDSSKRKAIYKAAMLHSAQALLNLDENYNLKEDDSTGNCALDEMKHQIEVYLTEVSRIHELVTIKEQQRDELLKEYLDFEDDLPRSSSVRFQTPPTEVNLPSSSTLHGINSVETYVLNADPKSVSPEELVSEKAETASKLKMLQEEISITKSVVTYMVSSCSRLENLLMVEKEEKARCAVELESNREILQELKSQLEVKSSMVKRLNSLIETMRSKKCNDEITLEQLKSEIKWLIEENQKIFDKVSAAQAELCQCKEKNSRIQNDLDSLKRQLMNEKYEHSKVLNKLRHLKSQVLECPSTASDT